MQAKGLIKFFAIALAIVCLFQLSFTLKTYFVEKNAEEFAEAKVDCGTMSMDSCLANKKNYRQRYLDSITNETVYNLLVTGYTYEEIKENQLNLGLDLQGGMSVIMQVSIADMMKTMAAGNANDPNFVRALKRAQQLEQTEEGDFVDFFIESWNEVAPNSRLAPIFDNRNQEIFEADMTDQEVAQILHQEAEDAVQRTYEILRARIDQFGVSSPNISRIANSDRIMVELPGVDNPNRVRKLLQSVANLEFWETHLYSNLFQNFVTADAIIQDLLDLQGSNRNNRETQNTEDVETPDTNQTTVEDDTTTLAVPSTADIDNDTANPFDNFGGLAEEDTGDGGFDDSFDDDFSTGQRTPLISLMNNATQSDYIGGPMVGSVEPKDTATVNEWLGMEEVRSVFPENVRFLWGNKANDNGQIPLYAIKTTIDQTPPLEGDVVTDANQEFDPQGNPNVTVSMNSEGAAKWEALTGQLAGQGYVAIVLDRVVYSAPFVRGKIAGGNTEITGDFTVKEAKDLANILKAGKLPAKPKIVQESQVGPTLGAESIRAGIISMVAGLILVLLFMIFYYSTAGLIADIALIANIFFVFGVLASLGATLTLPGIAGIVLTIGMAVDANVIIFERIREEILRGKGARLALVDGFKQSYSAIIDANLTTLITAVILFYFGMGPVLGFATVLIIGIFSSLFTAVLLSRMIFEWMIKKEKNVAFGNKLTISALSNININFVGKRKMGYIISSIIILISLGSFFTKGFDLGVDFKGGRSYEVRFDHPISATEIRTELTDDFGGQPPVVKTSGTSNQLKITTAYMIDSVGIETDSIVQMTLLEGLQPNFNNEMTYAQFTDPDNPVLMSYHKVEPTIADDIKRSSIWAAIFALLGIFVYILFRFRRWQYSAGAIAALTHDVIITLGIFSLFWGILPFSMELDQTFIAAILTVIGYSMNDTVVVFDRIREFLSERRKEAFNVSVNSAVNTTLSRTVMTSLTTMLVILILFIFGGDVIRGFAFAILIGIIVGTYSSVFIATPVMIDLTKQETKIEVEKKGKKARATV